MHLSQLKLFNFKNYSEAHFRFSKQLNCLTGSNGSGKTNVLDAIYYLAFSKSYFSSQDIQNIRHDEQIFSIDGVFENNNMQQTVHLAVQRGNKKQLLVNNNEYQKFSEHIGNYPLVIIAPDDIGLIQQRSAERRRFMDGFISQLDKLYLNDLLQYNRTLEQRNYLLKQFYDKRPGSLPDQNLLDTYNRSLSKTGTALYEKRKEFLKEFIPIFKKIYENISKSRETTDLIHISDLHAGSFDKLLEESEEADLALQRTTKGVHRDDLEFFISGYSLKRFGSQGQQKSFIIALKLAQFEYLDNKTQIKPLLLLDDIFEKLDGERLKILLEMIADERFGQIFISDTHEERLKEVFDKMDVEVRYFSIENGILK